MIICVLVIAIATTFFSSASAETTLIQSDFTGTTTGIHTPWLPASPLDPNLTCTVWELGSGLAGVDEGINDVLQLTSEWDVCPSGCAADLDNDSSVGINDLLVIISVWGNC